MKRGPGPVACLAVLQSVAHGLRFEHDAAAQAHDLCANLIVAGRVIGPAAAGARGRARRR